MIRIWLNWFWRIWRILTRIAEDRDDMEVVAINSRADASSHAHLLQYDSTYGTWTKTIEAQENSITINGRIVHVSRANSPAEITWDAWNVDCVVDATGKFTDKASLSWHMRGSVSKVICSAPGKWLDATLVLWVNEAIYKKDEHHIVSNASCTTNWLGPVMKILQDTFGVESATFNTIHAVTATQNILDNSHKKNMRIARSYGDSIIPTSTWASKAIEQIMPELAWSIQWSALRVPTATVSFIDLVVQTKEEVTMESLQSLLRSSANDIVWVNEKPLVSIDFRGDSHSGIVDLPLTQVLNSNLLKLGIWYDNERWYACRVADLVKYVM